MKKSSSRKIIAALLSIVLCCAQTPVCFAQEGAPSQGDQGAYKVDASAVEAPLSSEEIDWDSLEAGIDYEPNQLIVTFEADATLEQAQDYVLSQGWKVDNQLSWDETSGWKCLTVTVPEGSSLKEQMALAEESDLVLYVELNGVAQSEDYVLSSSKIYWDYLRIGTDCAADRIQVNLKFYVPFQSAKETVEEAGFELATTQSEFDETGYKAVGSDEAPRLCVVEVYVPEGLTLRGAMEKAESCDQFAYANLCYTDVYFSEVAGVNMGRGPLYQGSWTDWYDWDAIDEYNSGTVYADYIWLTFESGVSMDEALAITDALGFSVSQKSLEGVVKPCWVEGLANQIPAHIPEGASYKKAIEDAQSYQGNGILYAGLETLSSACLIPEAQGRNNSSGNLSADAWDDTHDNFTSSGAYDYVQPWYFSTLNLSDAWSLSQSAGEVSIAVLDSKITAVDDLKNNIDEDNAADITGYDGGSDHGNYVASVIAGQAGNSLGATGSSANATIVPVNIVSTVSDGHAYAIYDDIVDGINYVVDNQDAMSNVRVINISYTGSVYSTALQIAVNRAAQAGITVVCSAGNENSDNLSYPSDLNNVVSVIATDQGNGRASFSNYGSGKDVSAPGTHIAAVDSQGSSCRVNGTSFAAALVSGVVALMYAANPAITPATVETTLRDTATDLGATGPDSEFGCGMVNAQAAVSAVMQTADRTSIANASVSGVDSFVYYTGHDINQTPVVTLDGQQLTEGTDYRIIYQYPSSVGEYRQTVIVGEGDYYGTLTFSSKVMNMFTRLSGEYALDTMGAIVDAAFLHGDDQALSTGSQDVIICTMWSYYDALTAAGLAGILGCPVLMTDDDELSPQTAQLIQALGATHAYIAGGTDAVSQGVADQVEALVGQGNVDRVWGEDACGTALALYQEGRDQGVWGGTAIVCTASSYLDGMAASPYSYAKAAPVFLTNGSRELDADALDALEQGGFDEVIVMGGTDAVSAAVESQLASLSTHPSVSRMAGDDSYETAALFAARCLADGMQADGLAVTTTASYYDALCASSLCGRGNAPLLYAAEGYEDEAAGFLADHAGSFGHGYVLGGTYIMPESIVEELTAAVCANN